MKYKLTIVIEKEAGISIKENDALFKFIETKLSKRFNFDLVEVDLTKI